MKKLLMTSAVVAAVAGSQMGYAACADSGLGTNATPATCDADVTLTVENSVVIKGLDDYDFTNAPGWDGTGAGASRISESLCIGTNNTANPVNITFTSTNGAFNATGASGGPIAYSIYFNGAGTASAYNSPAVVPVGVLGDLACATEAIDLDIEFGGADLLTAVGGVSYSDTVTVTVAPQ